MCQFEELRDLGKARYSAKALLASDVAPATARTMVMVAHIQSGTSAPPGIHAGSESIKRLQAMLSQVSAASVAFRGRVHRAMLTPGKIAKAAAMNVVIRALIFCTREELPGKQLARSRKALPGLARTVGCATMKIASIVGARPEFVQAAVVSQTLRERHEEILIHTGQHYDDLMSDVFFRELALPSPDVNLAIGSMGLTTQLARAVERLARVFCEVDPDIVIVRGDTNSTLAGALAARQNGYALAHIEAGMRSFDRTMPEEVNRVISDHIADWLFVTGPEAAKNLRAEGIICRVHNVGDVMYDTFLRVSRDVLPTYAARAFPETYYLLTIHRQENTQNRERLERLIGAFSGAPHPVVFPVHPRTRARIDEWDIAIPPTMLVSEPLSYLDMLVAESGARVVFTDSGGVQREAYYTGRPCVTLRESTEWGNTIDAGWNHLVGSDPSLIHGFLANPPGVPRERPQLFGDGSAARKIADILDSPEARDVIDSWAVHRRTVLL